MFDEPSLGLSPILVQEVFEIAKRINREGVTIMLVEQNVRQTLGDVRPGLRAGERPGRPAGNREGPHGRPARERGLPGYLIALPPWRPPP